MATNPANILQLPLFLSGIYSSRKNNYWIRIMIQISTKIEQFVAVDIFRSSQKIHQYPSTIFIFTIILQK